MAINWHKDQPIIHQLRIDLVENFPFFAELKYGKHWSGIGAYVNRTTKAGGFSAHSEGRAADIYLFADKPNRSHEKLLGDGLAGMFFGNMAALGVDHIMWNRQIWSVEKGGPRPIPATAAVGPHTDHVHVAFTRTGSQKQPALLTTLIRKLRKDLDAELYGKFVDFGRRLEGFDFDDWSSPYDTKLIKRAALP